MTRADAAAGLLLAAGFGLALWEAWSFQYGTEFAPGPGFAPVWLSAIGLAIALAIAFGGWRKRRPADEGERRAASKDKERIDKGGLLRVAATLFTLAAMIAFVPWIGFVPAILGLLLILTLGVQRMSIATGLAASVGTVVFVYLVFVHFLHVPIPGGPLGF